MVDYNMNEADQVELIKKWWNQYGFITIVAIIVAILIVVGWHYYQRHQVSKSNQAALTYGTMLSLSQHQSQQAQAKAKLLISDYKGSAYATLAGLWLAKDAVNHKQLNQAEQYLSAVVSNSKGSWHDLAEIRLARVYLADKQPKQASASLRAIKKDSAFVALAAEVRGDVAVATHQPSQATRYYQQALAALPQDSLTYSSVQHKLANLPVVSAPMAAAKAATMTKTKKAN